MVISIPCDGIRLHATLDMPVTGTKKCPIVIIVHGFTGHSEERHLTAVSKVLNSIGHATLRVDMYGHGQSEGSFHDHTLFKWLTCILAAVDCARSLDFVSGITLMGHSQGGLAVILAGAMTRDLIRGIVPLSPACMIPEAARKGEVLGTKVDPDHIPDELSVWGEWKLGGNYIRVAQTLNVEEAIDRYPGPVLIVQGDRDDPGLTASALNAAKRYRNCELAIIQGDTHCYDHHLDEMTEAVRKWFIRQDRSNG